MGHRMLRSRTIGLSALLATGLGGTAWAQTADVSAEPPAVTLPTPGMTGPLLANPHPTSLDAGPLGKIYVTGVVSGIAQFQDNLGPGDKHGQADLSNGQVFIQKTDGFLQFFVQAGAYSLPDLGLPYIRASKATDGFYGPVPQAFVKLVPNEHFSIVAGKLPTLIGAEYTFSFENINIQRGLLWNQENAVNRGVQVNYSNGPLTLAASVNDGMYSNRLSWIWGSASYAIDKSNTVAFIASGNTSHTSKSTLATPLYQNNEQLYNLIYTHLTGPWTLQTYLQYTYVPKIPEIGANHSASTFGAAGYAVYAVNDNFKVAARAEYITSSGNATNGAPNLLYGPGSDAWSLTITPTYQRGIFFARAEASYVRARQITPGLALGPNGLDKTQSRVLIETGVLF